MILADTSVWVDHLRRIDPQLDVLLKARRVVMHPFVIGEIALGNLAKRETILASLRDMPAATVATDDEVLDFIERFGLAGRGIGYTDAHLLASARLTEDTLLWTRDKRLALAATDQNLDYRPASPETIAAREP